MLELLAGKLQIKGTFRDLVQGMLLQVGCPLTALPEVLLGLLVHVEQLLQFFDEVSVI